MAGPPLLGGTGKGLAEGGALDVTEISSCPAQQGWPPCAITVVDWPIAIGARINIARRATVARNIALFTSPPFLCMYLLLLPPQSMPHNEAWRISTEAYSPECVEGVFSEIHLQHRA
jgi:hypothetical protein